LSSCSTNLFRSRITVHNIECPTGCSHEAVMPPDVTFEPLVHTTEPAREYSFKLDPFQQRAVLCIDNLQSVLVSAHTSAGKTVVAE
jgi:ATP-dependent RNA helicase DOB1